MPHPVDEAKLNRVREAMDRAGLDAVVVSAADNVLYLSDYWTMKGGDFVVFPRDGDATLIVLEPQLDEANRVAWTQDVRGYALYDPRDPRPPAQRKVSESLAPPIVAHGAPMRNIAPCAVCHGGMDSKAGSAWLDGLPAAYTKAQLVAFGNGARTNDINEVMRNVARNMTPEEIDEAAMYYARELNSGK